MLDLLGTCEPLTKARLSIPDAPRPVMRYAFCAFSLDTFHGIVQEEIDQDRVDVSIRVPP